MGRRGSFEAHRGGPQSSADAEACHRAWVMDADRSSLASRHPPRSLQRWLSGPADRYRGEGRFELEVSVLLFHLVCKVNCKARVLSVRQGVNPYPGLSQMGPGSCCPTV